MLTAVRSAILLRVSCIGGRAFDDFIKLPTVEPDTPAIWTVVNFDAVPVSHNQTYVAIRAFHRAGRC